MVTEIELKAHVADYEAIKLVLSEKAKYLGVFEKEDSYWFPKEASISSKSYRLRKEKREIDGMEKSASFISYKKKEVRDEIEINEEREFEVKPGELAGEFFHELGFESGISKRKRGWAYTWEGITAELVEVEGLGWFVELEILIEKQQEENFEAAKKRLLDFLDDLGIKKEALESRFYTEMLLSRTPSGVTVTLPTP